MATKKIDLSGIKENDLDKTSSFTDLMTRSERKRRKEIVKDDIEDMVDERKRSTKDLTIDLERANKRIEKKIDNDEEISKTQTLDITTQMKLNLEEVKKENYTKKKKGISILNVIGELNLICIGFYIYRLIFTNYQDNQLNYTINGGIIVLLVFLFGLSIVSNKSISKIFKVLNFLAIFAFVVFNVLSLI